MGSERLKMQHRLKLTVREKIKIWLDLCDFSWRIMKSALSKADLKKRLEMMRKEHIEDDRRILRRLGKLAG